MQSTSGTLSTKDAIQGVLASLIVLPKIVTSWTGSQADFIYAYFLVLATLIHLYILWVAGPSKEEIASTLQDAVTSLPQNPVTPEQHDA